MTHQKTEIGKLKFFTAAFMMMMTMTMTTMTMMIKMQFDLCHLICFMQTKALKITITNT